MRYLIDGYNLMFAQGILGKNLGPDRFRKVRNRFLDNLADRLGPVDAYQTTVVFDAADPPAILPRETSHKGLTVVFAVDDENADERIEQLIAEHSAPKTLTVVSSDHRIRQAASRRKARALTCDEFLSFLETRARTDTHPPSVAEEDRERTLSPADAEYWLREFGPIEEHPETRDAFRNETGIPTDAEIAEIEREVEREFGADS